MAASPTIRREPGAAKDKSTERIDGIVSLIGIGRAMVAPEQPQPLYQAFFV
jgi:hypothetical protein